MRSCVIGIARVLCHSELLVRNAGSQSGFFKCQVKTNYFTFSRTLAQKTRYVYSNWILNIVYDPLTNQISHDYKVIGNVALSGQYLE